MPGIINVDFADVKNIMQDAGIAIVGVGVATGPDRAVKAVNSALHSPLLETSPEGAKSVLLGITGGRDLRMNEVNDAAKIVAQTADPTARIIFGAYYDRNLKPGQLKITVVAAGFNNQQGTALFGTNALYNDRQSVFGSRTAMDGKKPSTPMREPVVHARGDRGDESADEIMASRTGPNPVVEKKSAMSSGMNGGGSTNGSGSSGSSMNGGMGKEKESDAWDIPAFLRRRKR